ncbi:hypothetical protein NX059_011968 [Plenodomus lindquistii]|nr:hypothetical protein NX059_011968 [Plenodomus lindquistii]
MSLLLLLGGEIVQKALAQLVGPRIRLPGRHSSGLAVAPVVFSFGWAAYAFSNLVSVAGNMRLMPPNEYPSILVTCSNGFVREVHSWVLGRLLRDHEIRCEAAIKAEAQTPRISVHIDVFHVQPVVGPKKDWIWWLGWATMAMQLAVALIPWIVYSDWAILVVTLCGNLLALITGAIPQWAQEKWAASPLQREKVTCLTRGNGHRYIMVFVSAPGALDLERLATGTATPSHGTRFILQALAVMWTCIVITVSGLQENTWFIIAIGGLGMAQNICAAGSSRSPEASNFALTRDTRVSTIIGVNRFYKDDPDASVDLDGAVRDLDGIASWVYGSPTASAGINPLSLRLMPEWLESFSKEHGVPSWLEPIEPLTDISSQKSLSPPTSSTLLERVFGHDKKTETRVLQATGVHGALIELEKIVPTAGLAMVQVFFPTGLQYNDASIRDNVHKKFWSQAYHTRVVRQKAAEKRRSIIQAMDQSRDEKLLP